ncbi:MAG: peptidoglycan-binding protein [Clostridia bacterium]|nr:peptidoglycan-binding protein [Clostridia bacterium]
MKNSKGRLIKGISLVAMLAVCMMLTGCVVPPDDIGANGNYVVTDNDPPFQQLAPQITNTPYVAPVTTNTPEPTKNWGAQTQATPTPTVATILPGSTTNPLQNLVNITPQVIITTATATPDASTGTLKVGSTGDDVRKMQNRLKELGYLKGSADGDFGAATETAVKAFQAQNGLTVDGKAGTATLNKLYSASAKKAPTTTVTNTPKATATPFTSYKHGDTGSEVKRMQQRLKELGYLNGKADGDFGDATEAAVRYFQQRNGLTVDGKAGTKTLEKLYSSSAKAAVATPTPTAKPTNTPKAESLDYYLENGSSGTKVRTLQKRLIELGWLDGEADGKYGNATEYAVKAFQKRYSSLWDDGVAGPDTLKQLYGAGAATTKTPAATLGMSLSYGDEGEAVKAMQKRLKELGFYTKSIDGDYGSTTKAAVIAFQNANGLTDSGKATEATLNKLYSASAKDADYLTDEENAKKEEDEEETYVPENDNSNVNVEVNGYTTLRWGDTGAAVKKLQEALKNRGYYSGKIDSTFGSGVYAAVKAFQKQYGLKADGVAGPATQNLLYNTSASSSDTSTTLKKGSSGTAVRNLQAVLAELGYYDGSINGEYGNTTADAVRAFQINNDISPVDGVAGSKTLKVIYSSKAVGATASSGSYETLSKGDKGTLVVEMQEALKKLGYLSEVTGEFDSATVEAVKNFQRRNNLTVNGKANSSTLSKLYSKNAEPAW